MKAYEDNFTNDDIRVTESFRIYSVDDQGGNSLLLGSTTLGTTYQVASATSGCFVVSAYDSDPAYESGFSNVACVDEPTCPLSGDTNGDETVNVADIITLVNIILGSSNADDYPCADTDANGSVNVADIVKVVNIILYGRTVSDADEAATNATIVISEDTIKIESNGFVQGVQMTLSFSELNTIELADSYVSEYKISDNTVTLVAVTDGSTSLSDIATFVGDNCKVESAHVVDQFGQDIEIEDTYLAEFKFQLAGPNPFNPSTTLNVVVPEAGYVSVNVYNILGQEVATLVNGYMEASTVGHSVNWTAENLASGVYFVKAIAAGEVSTQKLMLLK